MKNGLIVEVCGGIASGKTTFAALMTNIGLIPVLEDFKKSPFWEAFYRNPGEYIFETEISFILLHYHQIKKALARVSYLWNEYYANNTTATCFFNEKWHAASMGCCIH